MTDATRTPPTGGSGTAPPRTPLPQIEQFCNNCRFWEGWDYTDDKLLAGLCRRRAPLPTESREAPPASCSTYWPSTDYQDWCGEWEYAPPPPRDTHEETT